MVLRIRNIPRGLKVLGHEVDESRGEIILRISTREVWVGMDIWPACRKTQDGCYVEERRSQDTPREYEGIESG